jgi:hypothetical protein
MNMIETSNEPELSRVKVVHTGGTSDSVYGLGFIGALIYYISRATSFQMGVSGFFKAIVWPAILVYELLKFFEGVNSNNRAGE